MHACRCCAYHAPGTRWRGAMLTRHCLAAPGPAISVGSSAPPGISAHASMHINPCQIQSGGTTMKEHEGSSCISE